MTRRQQLTPATIELHRDLHGQSIDRSDPSVQKFMLECGLATGPVHIRLTGEENDLIAQIERLEKTFGSLISLTKPRQQRDGVLWDAYGTLLA